MTPPLLPPRPHDSHKGLLGHVGIVGGAPGMVGAALLAGRAALQCGAGRVTLGVLDAAVHVDFCAPELMFAPPETLVADSGLTVLAIGPGLGQTRAAVELLQASGVAAAEQASQAWQSYVRGLFRLNEFVYVN